MRYVARTAIALICANLHAQTPPAKPQFEVASVKPAANDEKGGEEPTAAKKDLDPKEVIVPFPDWDNFVNWMKEWEQWANHWDKHINEPPWNDWTHLA